MNVRSPEYTELSLSPPTVSLSRGQKVHLLTQKGSVKVCPMFEKRYVKMHPQSEQRSVKVHPVSSVLEEMYEGSPCV